MTNAISSAGEFTQAIASPRWPQCEDLIRRFEDAWQLGRPPSIDSFLLDESDVREALLVELIHVDLEFRFKQGKDGRVEDYLVAHPELADEAKIVVDLLSTECRLRLWKGEEVSPGDFARRFPRFRQLILQRLSAEQKETRIPAPARARRAAAPLPAVPGYEVLEQVGRGGMGIVYKAREPALNRHVALKFLPPEYASSSDRLQRFLNEARTASSLNHPNICTVHALEEHNARPFLVLEFVEGETLQALSQRRPQLEHVTNWLRQASRALAAAHSAGVVHRDVKPENIMVRDDGFVKVLDFGLARRLPTLGAQGAHAPDTDPGVMLGTVAYMSPEQTRGGSAESASDIFSLGIVAYQLVTGVHPFDAETPLAMLNSIATAQVIPPARCNPAVPAGLSGLIESMLLKDPRLRPSAADVETALATIWHAGVKKPASAVSQRPIVHREAELAVLRGALANAEAGHGSFVCIAGEPGIGKTTLVEDFLNELVEGPGGCLVARGNCSEVLAETEAYLPVIDALENLLRSDGSGTAARLMRVVAPAWYSQLVAPAGSSPGEEVSPKRAASQGALLREFTNFLREATRVATVVLFLDDVHWSDHATVDLLAYLARDGHWLRLLVIVTYRQTEMALGGHPFRAVRLDLLGRGVGTELTLAFLGRQDVARYFDLAYPNNAFPPELAAQVHARTEGNPLFMAAMLGYLCQRGVLAEIDGVWSMVHELPDLTRELPASIRGAIERKIEQLEADDLLLITAASVQGQEFDSAMVVDVVGGSAAEVEERLQSLERLHGFVHLLREQEFPDGTLSQRYRFVHALYRHAVYDNLPPSRRASIAAALAAALEKRRGTEGSSAAELACLYQVARDFRRAARQFYLAAQHAARVFAHREAVVLARRGLSMLASLPESPDRVDLELALQTALGLQLQVTEGYAAPNAEQAYRRARNLCRGDEASFPVLWGLWLYHKVRSELSRAQEMAEELLALALGSKNPDLALQAHQALGMTAFCRGELANSLEHVAQVTSLYDEHRHRTHAFLFGHDPAVISKAYGAVVLWLLGHANTAQQQSAEAIHMSEDASPTSRAVARHFAAMVYQLCGDAERTQEYAEACAAIGAEHGLSFWQAGGAVLSGWALAKSNRPQEGIARLRRGLHEWRDTGSITYETYYLGLLAELLAEQMQCDESLRLLEKSLELVDRTGERFWAAELHRLRGEIVLRIGQTPDAPDRADADFVRSLEIAQGQSAKGLEMRSAGRR